MVFEVYARRLPPRNAVVPGGCANGGGAWLLRYQNKRKERREQYPLHRHALRISVLLAILCAPLCFFEAS